MFRSSPTVAVVSLQELFALLDRLLYLEDNTMAKLWQMIPDDVGRVHTVVDSTDVGVQCRQH